MHVNDADRNILIVGGTADAASSLISYDEGDQFVVGPSGSQAFTDLAAFEAALAKDADDHRHVD